jgi:uncharacterized protein involved in response to NO
LGFRPFFLLAGSGAAVLMLSWLMSWHGHLATPAAYYGQVLWHAHEMLFGYIAAVIAGFLLTAVHNWTGQPTLAGWPLGGLAVLWLAGRLAPWFAGIPPLLIAVIDMAFFPALLVALVKPLWAARNRSNRWFAPLLLGMALANALIHAQALGWTSATAAPGNLVMLDLVVLLLIFVGGRILPFFTEKGIVGAAPRRYPRIERLSIALPIAMAGLHLAQAPVQWTGLAALATGLIQCVRWWGWHDRRAWQIPILWVLYTGYAWLAIGLILVGLSEFGMFPRSPATHALTAGALGVFTLGMMARVALGHTGRPMRAPRPITLAFVVANMAAALRVLGPAAIPSWYVTWILSAGLLWLFAFALFTVIYAPILVKARVDGRCDQ